jgi:hypothetical protein
MGCRATRPRGWGAQRLPRRAGIAVFSREEVMASVRAAGNEQDGVLYLTAAFTGLRLGELLALPWEDVDFEADTIRVRRNWTPGGQGTPKSGREGGSDDRGGRAGARTAQPSGRSTEPCLALRASSDRRAECRCTSAFTRSGGTRCVRGRRCGPRRPPIWWFWGPTLWR